MIAEFSDPRLVAIYETVNEYELGTQPDFCRELATEIGATTIVDLGCGTGLITRELARLGYDMIGVDPVAADARLARAAPVRRLGPLDRRRRRRSSTPPAPTSRS